MSGLERKMIGEINNDRHDILVGLAASATS
jgi:hypothetical protein